MTLLLSALLACAPTADSDSSAPDDTADTGDSGGPPKLELRLQMDVDLQEDMDEPAVGVFRGSIYREEDASAIGNDADAVPLADVTSDELDLVDGGPTDVFYSTGDLEPQVVWVLGCLDTDGNDCDKSDPVTIPNQNKLEIAAAGTTSFTVQLNVLNPG